MTAFSVVAQVDQLTTASGPPEEAGAVCDGMFRLTGNESIARISDLFVNRPLKIALVLALAWVGRARRASLDQAFHEGPGNGAPRSLPWPTESR